jgi:hypothetical protein
VEYSDQEVLAFEFLRKGNIGHARVLFEQLLQKGSIAAKNGLEQCKEQFLRKCYKQQRVEDFLRESSGIDFLASARARLLGNKAVEDLSQKDRFAKLFLHPNKKDAFVEMRQISEWKEYAEGWISLLKLDADRARTSFLPVEKKWPWHAKIGLCLVDILFKKNLQAQQRVDYLKPVVAQHFPEFARALGWESYDCVIAQNLRYGNEEDLEKLFESSISSGHKGLISLRLGDLAWENKKIGKAKSFWLHAKKLSDALEVDVLKRLFVCDYETGEEFCSVLRELYLLLYRKNKPDAKEFLETVVFEYGDALGDVPVPFLKAEFQWEKSVPSEVILLYLIQQSFVMKKWLPYFDNPDKEGEDFWRENLNILDSEYSLCEKYLRLKIDCTSFYDMRKEKRRALFSLLLINPSLKEELIGQYVQMVFLAREECEEELRKVSEVFPTDYDLIRLRIYFGLDPLETFARVLSPALYAVLCLQVAIDRGKKPKLPMDLVEYKKDAEASFRLFDAVSQGCLPVSSMTKAFDVLVEEPKKTFRRIFYYGFREIGPKFIAHWKKKFPACWAPHYYSALQLVKKNELLFAMMELNAASDKVSREDVEFHDLVSLKDLILERGGFFNFLGGNS